MVKRYKGWVVNDDYDTSFEGYIDRDLLITKAFPIMKGYLLGLFLSNGDKDYEYYFSNMGEKKGSILALYDANCKEDLEGEVISGRFKGEELVGIKIGVESKI